ncbi:MAG: amidohydrolase [Solirubrobacterales bacterium]|nr:amidohydrolase [Solirubrobacterales bacterium]
MRQPSTAGNPAEIRARVLRNGRVLTEGALHARDVVVHDGRIVELVASGAPCEATDEVDARGLIVLPGLVDAHTHSYGQLCRDAIADDRLEAWLAFAAASTVGLHAEAAAVAAQLSALDALRHGATTTLDHATLGAEHAEALVAAYGEAGTRVAIAAQVADVSFADSLLGLPASRREAIRRVDRRGAASRAAQVDACHALIDAARDRPRISVLLGPSAPERCSSGLLDDVAALAATHGLGLHVHLLETRQQRRGGDPLGTLADHGLLRPGLSLAHCVHLDDGDVERVAVTGAAIVHNPMSNLALGSGRLDLRRLIDAGVTVGLGCDGWTTGGAQDVLAQARLALVGRRPEDPPDRWLTPADVWPLAAAGGGAAIGLGPGAGTLQVGAPADLLLVDPARAGLIDGADPVAQLVLGGLGDGLVEVWVGGHTVLRRGEHTNLDVERLVARAGELLPALRRAAEPLRGLAADLAALTREAVGPDHSPMPA